MSEIMKEHFPPRKILVPIDFSDSSKTGLELAKRLGKEWDSTLNMIYINEFIVQYMGENPFPPMTNLPEFDQKMKANLRELARDYFKANVRVLDGYIKETITTLAADEGDDLIIMGSHGRSGLSRAVLGSVAEAVVRASRVPVLTVHAAAAKGWPKRILVPVNFTDYSDHALLYALELARKFGAKLTAMNIVEGNDVPISASDRLKDHLEEILDRSGAAETLRFVDTGNPAECIVKTAEAQSFDLIVLAAHRKPFWKGWILGTTAERVLRHASIPVLSVPSTQMALEEEKAVRVERKTIAALSR